MHGNGTTQVVILSAVLWPLVATAQPAVSPTEKERPSHLTLQLDNDLFAGSDRDYTNGVRIALLSPVLALDLNPLQKLMVRFHNSLTDIGVSSGLIKEEQGEIRLDWGTGLTQLMYTPDDLDALVPPPGERPFAGWLGLEWSLNVYNRESMSSLTFVVGLTGPNSLAEPVQDFVHNNISNNRTFVGWDSQVPEEITFNLLLDRKLRLRRLEQVTGKGWLEMDGYLEWGLALGNFRTEAYAGVLLRLGYDLPLVYLTPRVQLGSYSSPLMFDGAGPKGDWSWGVFAGTRGTAVAHAITLDGPVFRDYVHSVESSPFVAEVILGVGFRYKLWQLVFARTFRTEEFEGQGRDHEYGSIMVGRQF